MSYTKSKGGLGFRNLHGFNIALLGKHIWNFMRNPDSLVAKVFKERYFSDKHVLKANKGQGSSLIWTGLWQAKEELSSGFRRVLGNVESIAATTDPWLRNKTDFQVEQVQMYEGRDEKVASLFMPGEKKWNTTLVRHNFVQEDADAILETLIPQRDVADQVVWVHENVVPVRWRLSSRGIRIPITCPMCETDVEHMLHLFYDCAKVFSTGMVLRNHEGQFLAAKTKKLAGEISVVEAEAEGIMEALSWIMDMGKQNDEVIIESDTKLNVDAIACQKMNFLEVGEIIETCKQMLSNLCRVLIIFVRKNANRVAHEVAKIPCLVNSHNVFTFSPTCLLEALSYDCL
ncbi:uncharacterized protein LOC141673535 [Apium graveolens]|uniref:uncharacterized protein LOC141673535 n=1 Tax=Apium graveolens TaxID=4045 RepID=UPI003D794A17